jgi:hypothetical protein
MGVIGSSGVTPHLQEITKERKVGASTISLIEWGTPNEIGACSVLFVPEGEKSKISSIVARLGNKSTLIVTESSGTIGSGADISFFKKEGKIQFELNKTNIMKKGLNVSSDLERLAAKVY